MEANAESNTSQNTFADKFCLAAIISSFFGIGLFLLLEVLDRHYRFGDILGLGILVSIVLVCFIAPFLGVIAIIDIRTNWQSVIRSDDRNKNGSKTRKIYQRFFVASLLFSLTVLLPVIYWCSSERTENTIMPVFFSVWLFLIAFVALIMAIISFKLLKTFSSDILVRFVSVFPIIMSIAAIAFDIGSTSYADYYLQTIRYSNKTESFSGSSELLQQTMIVPTLDSPLEQNKNMIWCSSFQLTWNELRDNIIKEHIVVVGAQEIADLLNKSKASRDNLDASSYFVATGLVRDGADRYIQTEMSHKFPGESVPAFGDLEPLDLIMYAFLTAQAKFKYPFKDYENGISFKDSNDLVSKVAAFGVWEDKKRFDKQRGQIDVFYQSPLPELESSSRTSFFLNVEEFAIDLCKHTEPYQIVLAKIEPKSTLGLTLKDLQAKISDFSKREDYKDLKVFHKGDTLSVPEMYWKIDHRLKELEGKFVSNPGFGPYPIKNATQMIHFRLDRYGAVLKSEAKLIVTLGKTIGRNFSFNKPFLIYMKKRDCEQPFFVMWVDNAELLNRK